eukprot:GHVL01021762.1.p1 GENE.GHVL01021762.1~~GHVL01021762.1.p1  ORF type:complete len:590 (+),score=119.64 GHVL01021762.1:39-1772(+)
MTKRLRVHLTLNNKKLCTLIPVHLKTVGEWKDSLADQFSLNGDIQISLQGYIVDNHEPLNSIFRDGDKIKITSEEQNSKKRPAPETDNANEESSKKYIVQNITAQIMNKTPCLELVSSSESAEYDTPSQQPTRATTPSRPEQTKSVKKLMNKSDSSQPTKLDKKPEKLPESSSESSDEEIPPPSQNTRATTPSRPEQTKSKSDSSQPTKLDKKPEKLPESSSESSDEEIPPPSQNNRFTPAKMPPKASSEKSPKRPITKKDIQTVSSSESSEEEEILTKSKNQSESGKSSTPQKQPTKTNASKTPTLEKAAHNKLSTSNSASSGDTSKTPKIHKTTEDATSTSNKTCWKVLPPMQLPKMGQILKYKTLDLIDHSPVISDEKVNKVLMINPVNQEVRLELPGGGYADFKWDSILQPTVLESADTGQDTIEKVNDPILGEVMIPINQNPRSYLSRRLHTLKRAIIRQVEFYFSVKNFSSDPFLLSQADEKGWVNLSLVFSFNRIKALSTKTDFILECLVGALSKVFEINEDRTKIRRSTITVNVEGNCDESKQENPAHIDPLEEFWRDMIEDRKQELNS